MAVDASNTAGRVVQPRLSRSERRATCPNLPPQKKKKNGTHAPNLVARNGTFDVALCGVR